MFTLEDTKMAASPTAFLVASALMLASRALAEWGGSKGDWRLRLGGAALIAPSYEGSDSIVVRPIELMATT